MRVVQIPLTYPLHYERLLTFTMSPAWSTPHSTQFLLPLAVHHKLYLDQCADACPFSSVDNYTPDNTSVCSDSSDEEEEEDFQMVPLDDGTLDF